MRLIKGKALGGCGDCSCQASKEKADLKPGPKVKVENVDSAVLHGKS